MRFIRSMSVLVTLPVFLVAGMAGCTPAQSRPELVVMIAVDQMRGDMLERYDELLTGGFRRLLDEGRSYRQTVVEHGHTISHPGHVTLATGLHPSRHGIVDAAFYVPVGGTRELVDAVADTTAEILGVPQSPGASPRNVLASSLADWIRQSDPDARVAAVGSGRYSALLHGGRGRGHVYWFDRDAGRYVTSTYYRDTYPPWLERFHRDSLTALMADSTWRTIVPTAGRELARRDSASYEAFDGRIAFPHDFPDWHHPRGDADTTLFVRWFAGTPTRDEATLALAREAVRALRLGQRRATDYLAIVLDQIDYAGHVYGPLSLEQLDTLLRLDRALGELFMFLDQSVGKDRYVVALSADHGSMEIPEYRSEKGSYGRRFLEEEINAILAAVSDTVEVTPDRESVAGRIVRTLESYDVVADAMSAEELAASSVPVDSFVVLFRNSFRPDRIPRFPLFSFEDGTSVIAREGVVVRLVEGVIIDLDRAIHGSPYYYDRHVPLIFMGPGVEPGVSDLPARTVDVAPTLADLAGIPTPAGLDGQALPGNHSESE